MKKKDRRIKKTAKKVRGNLVFKALASITLTTFVSVLVSIIFFYVFILKYDPDDNIPRFPLVLIIFLICFLFATGIAYLATYRMTSLIRDFSKATTKVAEGDFSVRIKEYKNITSDSQLGMLVTNFNKMVENLSQIETLQSDFISTVSHEFKTPLTNILGYVKLLEEKGLTEDEKKAYIEAINIACEKLNSLVTNTLKLSRLETKEIKLNNTSFSFAELIREQMIMLEPSWSAKELELDLDLIEDEYIGDENLISQICLNLFTNAIKYAHPNTTLFVKLSSSDENVVLEVGDTGEVIKEKELPYIFNKFYQGDTSRSSEGNGLGLSIVKTIVDAMEATIDVSSNEDVTWFIVRFKK